MNLEQLKKQGAINALKEELHVRINNFESAIGVGDFKGAYPHYAVIGELLDELIKVKETQV